MTEHPNAELTRRGYGAFATGDLASKVRANPASYPDDLAPYSVGAASGSA